MKNGLFFSAIIYLGQVFSAADSGAQEVLYYCSKPASSGAWQVYRKNLTDGITEQITSNSIYNYWWVVLSPNHKELLMLRSPFDKSPDQYNYNNCEMIKSNADGSDPKVLLADNQNNWFAFGNPQWHPNGKRILLIAKPGNSASKPFYLFTVDTSGKNPKQLTTDFAIDANWSADGKKIVFIGSAGGKNLMHYEVYKAGYNYSGNSLSNIIQLTQDNTRDHDPCFSPDDLQIAFCAGNTLLTNADIVSISTDGSDRKNLVNDKGVHGGPINWGSDGKIYFHSIYFLKTNFMIKRYDTVSRSFETLLRSPAYSYISPFYANLNFKAKITGTPPMLKTKKIAIPEAQSE